MFSMTEECLSKIELLKSDFSEIILMKKKKYPRIMIRVKKFLCPVYIKERI